MERIWNHEDINKKEENVTMERVWRGLDIE